MNQPKQLYFREVDRKFAEQKANNAWPMDSCEKCLRQYWACLNCGHSVTWTERPLHCPKCRHGEMEYRENRFCCQAYNHHVGSCCLHCGNDERSGKWTFR